MSLKNLVDKDWEKMIQTTWIRSENSILTGPQTALIRIKNAESDLELFDNAKRHQPPGLAHLMTVLKGCYGVACYA